MMKVTKFGGSSLADSKCIEKVSKLIISDSSRKIIVVSAPGKRHKDDIKVTDLLISCAEASLTKQRMDQSIHSVIERYREIIEGLELPFEILDIIEEDIRRCVNTDKSDRHAFIDCLKAAGEDNCAKLIAYYLKYIGVNAKYMNPKEAGLVLSKEHGNARVLPEAFERLKHLRKFNEILIFPGFFGYSPDGKVVTFSRGGSDITGAIIAAAIKADLYENFTDVDFVFCTNPSIIQNAQPISELTYREMRELSYLGFSVLHQETLEPVYKAKIPVCIKNTNNPFAKGTLIVNEYKHEKQNSVTGIASQSGFCGIHISKYMMNREVGFVRKILSILEDKKIPYEHIPSGIDHISIVLSENYFDPTTEQQVVEKIKNQLNIDDISVERNLSLITIVGENMNNMGSVVARALSALAKTNVNVDMISQGPCGISITFAVKGIYEEKVVKILYDEFFEHQEVKVKDYV